jgi:subtilisin
MAEKDDRPSGATRRTGETGDDSARKSTAPAPQSRAGIREAGNGGSEGITAPPGQRRQPYLIGVRGVSGMQGISQPSHPMDEVVGYLNRQEDVEVIKRIKLGGAQPFTTSGRSVHEVVVAKIEPRKAQWLQSVAPPHLIIEPDALLTCADYLSAVARVTPIGTLLPLRSVATEVAIRVLGEREQPLARAMVVVDGGGLPVQALTDDNGMAQITFFGGSIDAIQTLFIRPASNHWDRLIHAPRLSSGVNTVRLRPLAELYPNFPAERLLGWGQRLLDIDPSAAGLSGAGVRIGLIDSGCDNSHPLLRHVTNGRDFTAEAANGAAGTGWSQDLLSHGTHCAGIINASRSTGQGISGCAPEAELHVFKVTPAGRVSDLLGALDECIQRRLDLINMGVVAEGYSELVAQKLQEARHKGIACIAAAGNTGGPLAFPAMLPTVMAVGAVGKLKEFPADSSHALTVLPQLVGSDEIFAASFSGVGPQLAVCAPGVAIVSTVAGGGYAAADGTSAAAAHATGLAALVLAHHPIFQEETYKNRSEQRVQALMDLIRASAIAHFADAQRGGAGVPALARVPGGSSHHLIPSFTQGLPQFELGLRAPNGTPWAMVPRYF